MRVFMRVCRRVYEGVRLRACAGASSRACVCVHAYGSAVFVYTSACIRMFVCVYMCVRVCSCVRVCVIYILGPLTWH